MKKLVLLTTAFLVTSFSCYGEKVTTLSQALEKAYANNAKLSQEQAKVRASNNDVSKAKAGWRPSITANASGTTNVTNTNGTSDASNTPANNRVKQRQLKYGVGLQQN